LKGDKMSEYLNENKVYKMAKEIWSKYFKNIMSFDSYYAQVKDDIIMWFSLPPNLRPLFQRYKENTVNLTYYQLKKLKEKKK
jgi:hypothetical protein